MRENTLIEHRIMLPPKGRGTITYIAEAGEYNIDVSWLLVRCVMCLAILVVVCVGTLHFFSSLLLNSTCVII